MKLLKIVLVLSVYFSVSYGDIVRIGFDGSAMVGATKKDVKIATDLLMENVLTDIDIQSEFKYYEDITTMAKDMNDGKLEYISIHPIKLIKYFNLDNLEKAFGEGTDDKKALDLILLVRKDLNIGSWKDLRGKTVLLDTNNLLHELYFDYSLLLEDLGSSVNSLHSVRYSRSLLKLFFNKADAALVTRRSYKLAIELNPQMAQRIVLLEETNLSDIQLGFFRKGMQNNLKIKMIEAAKRFNSGVVSRQALDIYQTEKLVETDMSVLKPIQDLQNKYYKLKKNKGIE